MAGQAQHAGGDIGSLPPEDASTRHRNVPVRPSLFSHLVKRAEEFCVYHSLQIITHYFPLDILPWVEKVDCCSIAEVVTRVPIDLRRRFLACVDLLCRDSMLVPVEYDEMQYLDCVRKSLFSAKQSRIRIMVMHLTGHCNLRCKYCFVDGGKVPGFDKSFMDTGTARAAIDHFAKALGSSEPEGGQAPAIVFYGGEPLLNPTSFRWALDYIRRLQEHKILPSKLGKALITNGTCVTSGVVELIARHEVSVSLSLDGPRDIHNANRKTTGEKGTFDQAMRGFKNLRAAGVTPSIACVIAPQGVGRIEEIVRFFVEDLGVKALGMNHVSILPGNGFGYDAQYEIRFAEALLKGKELILQYGDVYERRMSQKLNRFLDRQITRSDCTGCGEQVAVGPTGRLNICQGYVGSPGKHEIGTVHDSSLDLNLSPVVEEWSRRSPLMMDACRGCVALAVCGGGCPRNAESLHGSIWHVDTAFCHFSKRAAEWMIWKKRDAQLGERTTGADAVGNI